MTERGKIKERIKEHFGVKTISILTSYQILDYFIADRKEVLEMVNKALTQLHEEAHDGIKDDYCYIHEIDAAFSEIDRAIDKP